LSQRLARRCLICPTLGQDKTANRTSWFSGRKYAFRADGGRIGSEVLSITFNARAALTERQIGKRRVCVRFSFLDRQNGDFKQLPDFMVRFLRRWTRRCANPFQPTHPVVQRLAECFNRRA